MSQRLSNIHPGEILQDEFLRPLQLSAYALAKAIGVPQTRISQIIHGKRAITADTALRLAKYFGNSPQFWLQLQETYDLEEERARLSTVLEAIEPYQKKEDAD